MNINLNYFSIVFILISLLKNNYVIASNDRNSTSYEQNWIEIFKLLDRTVDNYSQQLVKQIETIGNESNINPFCVKSIARMLKNVTKEEWAAKSEFSQYYCYSLKEIIEIFKFNQ